MKRVTAFPALLLAAACTPSNQSRSVEGMGYAPEVPANPKRHDCAATQGNWARQKYSESSANFTFTGRMAALSLAKDNVWYAAAGVWGDFGDEWGPVLQMFAPNGDPSALRLVVRSGQTKKTIARIALKEAVWFRYTVDGSQIRVEANGNSFTFSRPSTPFAGMATSCSTGHFRFDKMKVQSLPEQSPSPDVGPQQEIATR